MGLGCGEETRQKHPRWCSLFDGLIGATWAAAPDNAGVLAVGTAALEPGWTVTGVSVAVKNYNLEMALQGKDDQINQPWAEQHPIEALKELKRRGYGLTVNRK